MNIEETKQRIVELEHEIVRLRRSMETYDSLNKALTEAGAAPDLFERVLKMPVSEFIDTIAASNDIGFKYKGPANAPRCSPMGPAQRGNFDVATQYEAARGRDFLAERECPKRRGEP